MINIKDYAKCSTETLEDELAVRMTNLTGGYLNYDRRPEVARETNYIAFELRQRQALSSTKFDEVVSVCQPYLPKTSPSATVSR
jgi:hypothetical protein